MRTLANECVRRGEGWHVRVLSTDSNQLTLIFSPTLTPGTRPYARCQYYLHCV